MKFKKEHAGKWVASIDRKVIDVGKKLIPLMKRLSKRPDVDSIKYDLVPKGFITGTSSGI